jgi:hypothetical protein
MRACRERRSRGQALLSSAQASHDLPVPVGPTIARWLCSCTHWLVARGLEEPAIEPPRSAIVDVLDGGGLTQLGGRQAA